MGMSGAVNACPPSAVVLVAQVRENRHRQSGQTGSLRQLPPADVDRATIRAGPENADSRTRAARTRSSASPLDRAPRKLTSLSTSGDFADGDGDHAPASCAIRSAAKLLRQ